MDLKAAMMRSAGSATRAAATSALQARSSHMEMEAPSVQSITLVKRVGKIQSLELAKEEKEKMEKREEKRRADRKWFRTQIEKSKKQREEENRKEAEKKAQQEKKLLKQMNNVRKDLNNPSKGIKKSGKLAVKQSSKLGKIEAAISPSIEEAPKEVIVPTVEADSIKAPAVPVTAESGSKGTDTPYQSRVAVVVERSSSYQPRPEARSSLPIMSCGNVRIIKELDGTKGGLDFWRKQEEARRARKECMRSEREKKEKKEEEERKKEQEKKLEEGRKLFKEMDQLNEALTSLRRELRREKKSAVKKPTKPCQTEAMNVPPKEEMTGTEQAYQSRPEIDEEMMRDGKKGDLSPTGVLTGFRSSLFSSGSSSSSDDLCV